MYRASSIDRRAAHHRATVAADLPEYASDIRPVRGRCRKGRCRSRWAVVRVSIDFRDPARIDRYATTECAACGDTWRRVKVPAITSAAGYQAVRLTLILPATFDRWYSRKRWHREGDDAAVLREATISDLDEAARNHASREATLARRKAADKARNEAADRAIHERTLATLARLAERDAARKAEEDAAAERDATYAA